MSVEVLVNCRNAVHSNVTVCIASLQLHESDCYHTIEIASNGMNNTKYNYGSVKKKKSTDKNYVRKTTLFMCVNWHHRNLDMSELLLLHYHSQSVMLISQLTMCKLPLSLKTFTKLYEEFKEVRQIKRNIHCL